MTAETAPEPPKALARAGVAQRFTAYVGWAGASLGGEFSINLGARLLRGAAGTSCPAQPAYAAKVAQKYGSYGLDGWARGVF